VRRAGGLTMAVGCLAQDAGDEVACASRAPHLSLEAHDQNSASACVLYAEPAAAWRSVAQGGGARDERVSWRRAVPWSAHARAGSSDGGARCRSVRLVMLGLAATVAVVCLGAVVREGSGGAPATLLPALRASCLPVARRPRVPLTLMPVRAWWQSAAFRPWNGRRCYNRG